MGNLLSVIIPVYNVENYLPSCLDSVLSQSYSNMEIIIIDDGSNDSSGEICDIYALKDSRILVFHIPNSGVSSARNLALSKARGKWITFVDSDDLVPPDTFRTFISVAEKNGVDIVAGGIRFDLAPEGNSSLTESFIHRIYQRSNSESHVRETLHNLKMSFWGKLYSKEILEDLKFPEQIPNYEDYTVLWQIALKSPAYATVDHIGYIARCRPGSASRSHDGLSTYRKRTISLLYACRKMEELFADYPSVRKDLTHFLLVEGPACKALYGDFKKEDKEEVISLTEQLWNMIRSTCPMPRYLCWLLEWRIRTIRHDINRFPQVQYAAIRLALRLI